MDKRIWASPARKIRLCSGGKNWLDSGPCAGPVEYRRGRGGNVWASTTYKIGPDLPAGMKRRSWDWAEGLEPDRE